MWDALYGVEDSDRRPNIMIAISGRGSNMAALLDGGICATAVVAMEGALGINLARERDVECVECATVQDVCHSIEEYSPDLVCLAGFMRLLPESVTQKFQIMNIHPSLLPHFPGLGAQKQALASGAKWTGCTVHMVDCGIDTGKIILQKAVPILPNDTVKSLSASILGQEHEAYAQAVRMFTGRGWNKKVPRSCKWFDDGNEAVTFALERNAEIMHASYMWKDGGRVAVSAEPPESMPHVVAVPGDTLDVLLHRLDNMIILDDAPGSHA